MEKNTVVKLAASAGFVFKSLKEQSEHGQQTLNQDLSYNQDFTDKANESSQTGPYCQNLEVLPEYLLVKKLIEHKFPLTFVTGGAGTGKSTLIKWLVEEFSGSVLLGAPTAIAALNIHGNTLHSLCHLPPAWIIKSDIRPLIHKTAFKCAKLLIIDEISMVTANLLDGVSATLRKSTGIDKPFGGIPVVLVGDLFQLPPVVSDSVKQLFEQYYDSPRFYSARSLRRNVYYAIELKKTFRQSEQSFVDVLAKIREGLDLNKSVIYLNKNTQITSNPDKGSVWLSPRNIEANKRNLKKLDELSSPETQYEGRIRGKFKSKNLPSPIKLSLKNKAQVMFTKNDIDFEWINGTIGVIEDMTENVISVRLSENDNIVHVRRVEWEEYQYRWDSKAKEIKRDITGTYIQFPLVLAWALTIHKSQGRTIDKVHLDLGYGAFATGQTYVAISRCRKINGLSMTRPLQERDILVDHDTKMFYRQLREKIESLPCLDILQKLLE